MTKNTLFPGRDNYEGPTEGWFGLLHHEILSETSHDVMERVEYVKKNKPKNEVAIRLHNMIYLGTKAQYADYVAKRPLWVDYEAKEALLYADYEAKEALLYADYKVKCAPLYADYEAKEALLYADYKVKCAPLWADYKVKCAPLYADYKVKYALLYAEVLAIIKTHIPDCAWNGKTLVFPA